MFNKLLNFLYLYLVIRFLKNSTNNVVVTLTENSTVTNPIYLFLFTNQTSNVPYYFISQDVSAYKSRYNKFVVVEDDEVEPNTVYGTIVLGFNGYYNYTVYQTSLTPMQVNLLTDAVQAIPYITKTVEVGVVDVVLDAQVNTEYDVQDETNIIYQPE
jgi:hypothetical protein